MANAQNWDKLLSGVFSSFGNELRWDSLPFIIILVAVCVLVYSIKSTSEHISHIFTVLIIAPIIAIVTILNFRLSKEGKGLLSFGFLKYLFPRKSEKSVQISNDEEQENIENEKNGKNRHRNKKTKKNRKNRK